MRISCAFALLTGFLCLGSSRCANFPTDFIIREAKRVLRFFNNENTTVELMNKWMVKISKYVILLHKATRQLFEKEAPTFCAVFAIHSLVTNSSLPALKSFLKTFERIVFSKQHLGKDSKMETQLGNLTVLEKIFSILKGAAFKNVVQGSGEPHQTMIYGLAQQGHFLNIRIPVFCRVKEILPQLFGLNYGAILLLNYKTNDIRKVVYIYK